MRRKLVVWNLLIGILLLLTLPLPAYELWGYKWPNGSTVYFTVNANTADVLDEDLAVLGAANSWSVLNPAQFKMVYAGSSAGSAGYNGENTVHWTSGSSGSILAQAQIWFVGGTTIVEADMTFWDGHLWCTSGCNYDVQTVALHEFGHWVGLTHDGGIMAPSYGGIQRSIDADNINGFYAMYGAPETFEVSITTPLSGQRLNGTATVSCVVKKPELLSQIQLFIDNVLKKTTSTSPLSYSWNTLVEAEGAHQLKAMASGSGQSSSDQFNVIVDNIHTLNVAVKPAGGGSVGVVPQKTEYAHGETITLQATGQGEYLFFRWEEDQSGSANPLALVMSQDMAVVARFNKPPKVTITSPVQAATVWGVFTVTADARDEDGIASVKFYLDNRLIHADMASPYRISLNSNRYGIGLHTLKALATDRLGMSASHTVSFIISRIQIALDAERKHVQAWLLSNDYGQLDVTVVNEQNIPISVFVIYRRNNSGEYAEIMRFSPAELQAGGFQYFDKFLASDLLYSYKIVALSSTGDVLGSSGERTI